jgi:hypothetical protein
MGVHTTYGRQCQTSSCTYQWQVQERYRDGLFYVKLPQSNWGFIYVQQGYMSVHDTVGKIKPGKRHT